MAGVNAALHPHAELDEPLPGKQTVATAQAVPRPEHAGSRGDAGVTRRSWRPQAHTPRIQRPSHHDWEGFNEEVGGPGVLAVEGLAKSYRGRAVVQDAGLYVRNGEAVGLLGPNGAGKTTIFYMITGLVPADHGRIYARRRRHHRACRCTGAPASASATCRRKPRSSAA